MENIKSNSIVFITGAFVSHRVWDEWKAYFENKGYTVIVPPWPYKDAPAEVLRSRQPDSNVASIGLAELTDYYANIVKRLPEKPIVIGHSHGGLIVQLLLQRGLAAAGVAIHSVPPQGILPLEFSFLRATWKPLGWFTSTKKTHLMSLKEWQYAFTNGMPPDRQKASYEIFAIPESKRALRGALTKAARVDFKKEHAPLLIIAGTGDHLIPPSVNRANFRKYNNRNSITDYREFKGHNHFVLGLPTWKEEADYIMHWLDSRGLGRKEEKQFATAGK